MEMVKSKNYLILGAIAVLGICMLSGCVRTNELVIQDYSYLYKKDTSSHQVRGIWETLSFKYENTEFTLESEQTYPGPSYGQTSFEYNFNDGDPIGLYSPGEVIRGNCVGNVESPDDFYSYGTMAMDCSGKLKLIILDTKRFNSCLESQSCTLTYGKEVEIIYE
ncbi:hypothetical protein CL622_05795 [archaeon]|nr:hypothetical protein [archaeon]